MTYSNFLSFDPIIIDLDLTIRFDQKIINGMVRHHFKALVSNEKQLYMDMGSNLQIIEIDIEKPGKEKKKLSTSDYETNVMSLSYQL